MGKLATTGRLVTRDNEEQKVSVWLLGRSDVSSGHALLAVSIREFTVRSRIATVAGSPTIQRNDSTGAVPCCSDNDSRRSRKHRRGVTIVRVRRDRSRDSRDERESRSTTETAASDEEGVVRLDASSSIVFPLDPWRGQRWYDDIVETTRDRKYRSTIPDARRGSPLCAESIERRTHVEAKESVHHRQRWCSRRWLAGSNELSLLFGIVTIVAVAAALCVPVVSAVPTLSRDTPLSRTGPQHDLDRSTGLEDVYEDVFEDVFPEEIRPTTTRTVFDETELDIIRRSIARGLGLERIPDPSKANVSQAEYERAHNEYLKKTQLSLDRQTLGGSEKKLHVFPATAYPGNESSRLAEANEVEGRYRHRLFFPVEVSEEGDNSSPSVDHATLRLLLHGMTTGDYTERSELDVLLYLRTTSETRKAICRRRIRLRDTRDSRWLEFDATLAASTWIDGASNNLGLEVEFRLDGEPVRRSFSSPFLNVLITRSSGTSGRQKRSSPEELMPLHKGRRTKCKGESKKCCRHELTVMFKELKGFEFIVYPKTFDAGYCKGRCPPRYNPAHHHALLQSLLWKEDRKKVPKPCCAPSKLDQLMIVYFDENDSTQLKVSYWKNIQVLECACS